MENEQENSKGKSLIYYVLGGIVLVALALVALFIARPHTANAPAEAAANATSTTGTTTVTKDGVTVSGKATVSEKSASVPVAPDYTKPLSFDSSVSADIRSRLSAMFEQVQTTLKKTPTDFSAWVQLGTLRKMTGDYVGAAEDWHYVAQIYPKSTVPFDNLGELYLDFLKNYPRAEANFKAAIELNPHDINAYQQLVSLYTVYGYKATSTARTLLTQGLQDNPNNQTLLELQQQLSQ